MISFAGISLGILIGFLVYRYLQTENGWKEMNPKKIGVLVATLVGSAILSAFPEPYKEGYPGYLIGLTVGVFMMPIWYYITKVMADRRKQAEKDAEEEIKQINSELPRITRFIEQKMERKMRQTKPGIREGTLSINELKELSYSYMGIVAIMKFFARTHIDRGVDLRTELVENAENGTEEEIYYLYQLTDSSKTSRQLVFTTTYRLGDDTYDESFSIDYPTGEFRGECGVGISESIGVGTPKKVTSFEVWLFDKNDVQTKTKVLTSAYSFSDNDTRKRLAEKGDLVLAKPGRQLVLETNTLLVVAMVVEMSYGVEDNMPKECYFDHITIKLEINL